MRYAVICGLGKIFNGQKDFEQKNVHYSEFNTLSDCFSFLVHKYEEAKYNIDTNVENFFGWGVFDFDNKKTYLYSCYIGEFSNPLDFFSCCQDFKSCEGLLLTILKKQKELKNEF
jgi:hypothetical protein